MAKIFLTALRVTPQAHEDRAVPQVYCVETADIVKQTALTADGGVENTHIKLVASGGRYQKKLKVAEKLGEVFLMQDFNNAASSPYNTGTKTNTAPAGSTQSAAVALTAYHNSITSAVAASNSVKLPNASGTGRLNSAVVIKNAASIAIQVFSSASEFLDGSSTAAATIASGKFAHFYASASDKWVTCKGPYY